MSHGEIPILPLPESIPVLGIALILAVAVGKVAHLIRIPQVTAYILVGVILGPTFLNLLSTEVADSFHLINELAFGLILFNIGGEFHRDLLKRVAWKHIKFSVVLASFIFLSVFLICFVFSMLSSLSFVQKLVYSSILGIIAIASAPPTTLLVIKEFEAQGPLTESIMVYLAVSTIFALIGAHGATALYQQAGIWQGAESTLQMQIWLTLWSLAGSMIVGVILGLGLSYWEQQEKEQSEALLAVICAILLGQTVAYYLNLEPLLVSLFIGFAVVNSSSAGQLIHSNIKNLGLGIYALFFVLAGAHLHIQEQLKTIGVLGLGYLVARTAGIIYSAKYAARVTAESDVIGKWMGFSVLSHAGAALAIVSKLHNQTDPSAKSVVTVVMASIFFFEILGPLALRYALTHAKEVSVQGLLGSGMTRVPSPVLELLANFFRNLGLFASKAEPAGTISPIINRNILAIRGNADYREIVNFFGKTEQPIYPVVNKEYKFEGNMSLAKLREIKLHPEKYPSVEASMLIVKQRAVGENATIAEAMKAFVEEKTQVLAITSLQTHRLVGVLTHKDIILAMK